MYTGEAATTTSCASPEATNFQRMFFFFYQYALFKKNVKHLHLYPVLYRVFAFYTFDYAFVLNNLYSQNFGRQTANSGDCVNHFTFVIKFVNTNNLKFLI